VSNWSEYDRALVQHGDITLWISEPTLVSPEQRKSAFRAQFSGWFED
jgi:hypothetical protein